MKYIYIFEKDNGEYEIMNEAGAYLNLYENANLQKMRYLGAVPEGEYTKDVPDIYRAVTKYKQDLISSDPLLQKMLEDSKMTNTVSPVEDDLLRKVNDFSKKLDNERTEKLIKIATKIYPDKRSNVMTPGGRRSEILQNM